MTGVSTDTLRHYERMAFFRVRRGRPPDTSSTRRKLRIACGWFVTRSPSDFVSMNWRVLCVCVTAVAPRAARYMPWPWESSLISIVKSRV